MGDLSALGALGMASAAGGGGGGNGGGSGGEPAAKRVCLRHYDLPPAQLLNPMGSSGIEKIPLDKLWEVLKKGNAKAAAFSELCMDAAG